MRARASAVTAPSFDRAADEPVPNDITIAPDVELVVEGNYLLLDGRWRAVGELPDEVWYLDVPNRRRIARQTHVDPHQRRRCILAGVLEWSARWVW